MSKTFLASKSAPVTPVKQVSIRIAKPTSPQFMQNLMSPSATDPATISMDCAASFFPPSRRLDDLSFGNKRDHQFTAVHERNNSASSSISSTLDDDCGYAPFASTQSHERRGSAVFPYTIFTKSEEKMKPLVLSVSTPKRRVDILSFALPPQAPVFSRPKPPSSPAALALVNAATSTGPRKTIPTTRPIPGPFIVDRLLQISNYCRIVSAHYCNALYTNGEQRVVCIKVFKKKQLVKQNYVVLVSNEIKAYKQLQRSLDRVGKKFIMFLHGALQDEKRLYYVMDLMNGDLMHILKYSPHKIPKHARTWVAQAVRGLSTIHKAGIIHRDLKPENLLIDAQWNIRIADFGCAYVQPLGHSIRKNKGYSIQRAGTYSYMAPEMWPIDWDGHFEQPRYNAAVDWWSLGCILWELENESHTTLFDDDADRQGYLDICCFYGGLQSDHLDFGSLHLDEQAEDLVLGLLRHNPAERYDYAVLRHHEYFREANGSSLFDRIDMRATDRPVLLGPSKLGVKVESPDIYTPIDIPDDTRDPFATSTYAWINPGGAWGTSRHQ